MLLGALITAFLSLLPFQVALSPAAGVDLPFGRVLAALIVFGWLIRGLTRRSIFLPPPLATGAIFSLLFIAVLSALWSEHPAEAWRKSLFLLNYFPLFFVFYDLGHDLGLRKQWIRALVWGAAVAALIGCGLFLLQFLWGIDRSGGFLALTLLPFFLGENFAAAIAQYPSLFVNIGGETLLRLTAFFPDPHVAAFFFGMTGLLALGLFLAEGRLHWLAIGGGLFLVDLLTFSRGGYLGLAAGLGTWLIWNRSHGSARPRRGLGLAFLLGLPLLLFFGNPVFSRFVSSFTLADASSSERLQLWTTAVRNIAERPFLGTGLGNYVFAINPLAPERFPYYAHNLFLDIATELGLVGLFFFLLLLLPGWFGLLRQPREGSRDPLSLAVFSALLLYLVHSLFETALFSVHVLPLLIFLLAWAWREIPLSRAVNAAGPEATPSQGIARKT